MASQFDYECEREAELQYKIRHYLPASPSLDSTPAVQALTKPMIDGKVGRGKASEDGENLYFYFQTKTVQGNFGNEVYLCISGTLDDFQDIKASLDALVETLEDREEAKKDRGCDCGSYSCSKCWPF